MNRLSIQRLHRTLILLRHIEASINNIDEIIIYLKLYNSKNQKLIENILFILENFPETYADIKKVENDIWTSI